MRKTEASGWIVRSSSGVPMHALRLGDLPFGAVLFGAVLGVGLVMTAGPARAQDAEVDQRSFSEKFVDGFKSTIRGVTMDNRGIDYRERSPLVVPPNLDLPPPASASSAAPVANWPRDPDERQRKAIIAAKKKNAPRTVAVVTSPAPTAGQTVAGATAGSSALPPVVITAAAPAAEPETPGTSRPAYASDRNGTALTDPVYDQGGDLFSGAADLMPSGVSDTLGLDNLSLGGLFGTSSSKKKQSLPPGTEPTREALTQPPSGYQTPSPNYPYGLAPRGLLDGKANPENNPAIQQSSASSVVH